MPYSSNKSSASCSDSRSRSRATGTRADTLAQTNCVEKAGKKDMPGREEVGLNRTRMGYERPSFYAANSHCRRGRHTQLPCWVCASIGKCAPHPRQTCKRCHHCQQWSSPAIKGRLTWDVVRRPNKFGNTCTTSRTALDGTIVVMSQKG